jgi:hypothetical protein
MSKSEGKDRDRRLTKDLMTGAVRRQHAKHGPKNWRGHRVALGVFGALSPGSGLRDLTERCSKDFMKTGAASGRAWIRWNSFFIWQGWPSKQEHA